MKSILEFNLPEDREEFNLALNGSKLFHIIHELDQYLRHKTKYAPESQSEELTEAYNGIRSKLRDSLIEENIEI